MRFKKEHQSLYTRISKISQQPQILTVPLFVIFLFWNNSLFSQCDDAALFQKYWQYKQSFNRHFIVHDRNEQAGCINDGIGGFITDTANTLNICTFEKSGFGLPATHLNISPDGAGIPGRVLNLRMDAGEEAIGLKDPDCGNPISWLNNGEDDIFNSIDFGSETLTQMGWHLTTLATEYELMDRSGQEEQKKRILEDIFLALQAIRRLDMGAQCMVGQMYSRRAPGEELVCSDPYTNDCHRHFDVKVKSDCSFTPDMSGYSGFMLRSDNYQGIDTLLNDPTDDAWNVDAVGGAYGGLGINNPMCGDSFRIDPFCYMYLEQHFLSHDQIINLFYGMAFLKKFIPPQDSVTLCDGSKFGVLGTAQSICQGITMSVLADPGSHITVPGSRACCENGLGQPTPAKLSECEGGNLTTTIYGVVQANYLIQEDGSPNASAVNLALYQRGDFNKMHFNFEVIGANSGSGRDFYLKQSLTFKEMSNVSNFNQGRIRDIADESNKEILLLGNDILFPGGESMADKVGGKEFFKQMLCEAPCTGPCKKAIHYGTDWPQDPAYGVWPEFECPNVPGWKGNRWDGYGVDPDLPMGGGGFGPRRGNGLDYMALFNMYMLEYGTDDFYNPEAIEHNPQLSVTYESGISGPALLCPGQSGLYEIKDYDPSTMGNIKWTSTLNFDLAKIPVPAPFYRYGKFNVGQVGTIGVINASLDLTVEGPQYYQGYFDTIIVPPIQLPLQPPPDTIPIFVQIEDTIPFKDRCATNWVKRVQIENPAYQIKTDITPCTWTFMAYAIEPEPKIENELVFHWTVSKGGNQQTYTGAVFDFFDFVFYGENGSGIYVLQLEVVGPCGSTIVTKEVDINICEDDDNGIERIVRVSPNPASTVINVSVLQTDGQTSPITDPTGYPVFIRNANGGTDLVNTRLYNNGQSIQVGQLSNGYYNLFLNTGGLAPLTTTFVISR